MAPDTYQSAASTARPSRPGPRREFQSTGENREPLLPPSEVETYSIFHTKAKGLGPVAVVELYGKDKAFLHALQFWEAGTTLPEDEPTTVNFPASNLIPIVDTLRMERPCYLHASKEGFWVGALFEPVGELDTSKASTPPPSDGGGITVEFPGRGDLRAARRSR
jgi:hypothetical protein